MSCRKNSLVFFVTTVMFVTPGFIFADFNKATEAYLLGQYDKARYEALIAATDGHAAAQMLLGQIYFNGEGVKKDIDHALYWYNRSADSGFGDAQYRLGVLYHDGAPGIQQNLDLAFIYLTQALESGQKRALEKLEWLHKTEQGIVVNLNDDVEVLKKVAASGNQKARFLLSQKMIKGDGITKDAATAVKMLREDAVVGFIKAQKQLGELFYYGNGVEKDYVEAYAWSMAYAGTKKLGGIAREGKQVARSALRKLPEETHHDAYVKSREYFESYVLPFHKNAREVGPEKYRIVVRSRVKKQEPAKQAAGKSPVTKQSDKSSVAELKQTENTSKSVVNPSGSLPDKTGNVSSLTVPAPAKSGPAEKSGSDKKHETGKTGQVEKLPESAPADVARLNESVVPSENTPAQMEKPESASVAQNENAANPTEQAKPVKETSVDKTTETKPTPSLGPVASREDVEVIPAEPLADATKTGGTESKPAPLPQRNFEDVYNVLVRKKSELRQIYAQEYELNKALQGRMVFELVIAANGKITAVEVSENTVDSPTLEQSLIDYLKNNVTFASLEVADFKISYPVDFLPP